MLGFELANSQLRVFSLNHYFFLENFVQKLFILILHDLDRGLCFAKLFCFENPASEVASLAQHRMTETCFLLRCVTRPVWTDLAKFLNFGNFFKIFGKYLGVWLLIVLQIFDFVNGPILQNTPAIRSHWLQAQFLAYISYRHSVPSVWCLPSKNRLEGCC